MSHGSGSRPGPDFTGKIRSTVDTNYGSHSNSCTYRNGQPEVCHGSSPGPFVGYRAYHTCEVFDADTGLPGGRGSWSCSADHWGIDE